MNVSVHKERLKKTAIAVVLLSIAQWAQGGLVICYGADGHIAIEVPAGKDCCKKNKPIVSLNQIAHFDLEHCLDIPIASQKYIASTSHTAPNHNHSLPHCMVSPSFLSMERTLGLANRRDIPPPLTPTFVTLKTVVLLI
jgi:hypothetical protein